MTGAGAFGGGLALGIGLGMLIMSTFYGLSNLLLYGACALCLIGGIALGSLIRGRKNTINLTGRVFATPHGPMLLEIALRRARAILGERS